LRPACAKYGQHADKPLLMIMTVLLHATTAVVDLYGWAGPCEAVVFIFADLYFGVNDAKALQFLMVPLQPMLPALMLPTPSWSLRRVNVSHAWIACNRSARRAASSWSRRRSSTERAVPCSSSSKCALEADQVLPMSITTAMEAPRHRCWSRCPAGWVGQGGHSAAEPCGRQESRPEIAGAAAVN
jgi:hypothetical protein